MTDRPATTPQRPYLLRAMHEWISDNGLTPHLIVDATVPGVVVPAHSVEDGRIILNVAWQATGNLVLGNDEIRFEARFGGVAQAVRVPLAAVIGIYARESNQGLIFAGEEYAGEAGSGGPASPDDEPPGPPRPRLRVIK